MTKGKDNNKPRIPDSVDMERLKKMQTVAKMKDFADQRGMGFVGGYYDRLVSCSYGQLTRGSIYLITTTLPMIPTCRF